jgi:hypothetical protein
VIVKEDVNRSYHPIKNPLLLVTEHRTQKYATFEIIINTTSHTRYIKLPEYKKVLLVHDSIKMAPPLSILNMASLP